MAGKYTVKPGRDSYYRAHKMYFGPEFETAKERLASLGGQVTPGAHDYEAFVYEVEGLRLIFYPHRTTAGNYHIRIRTSGKFNREVLRKAIFALAENTCTFQFPADPVMHREAVHAALVRETAAQQAARTKAVKP
jgi:hypothetical protein